MRRLLSALAAAAIAATPAAATEYRGDPTYGSTTVYDGLEPVSVQLSSGGPRDASVDIGGACNGFIAEAPDYRIVVEEGGSLPLVITATSDSDTTLVIDANGEWLCNDDSNGFNPRILISAPEWGVYDVWVGTYGSASNAPAVLDITVSEDPKIAGFAATTSVDASLPPSTGALTLASGFKPDPVSLPVATGGDLDLATIGTETCVGYASRAPDFLLTFEAGSLPLTFWASSSDDATLAVQTPDGLWYCDDDSAGDLNPLVTIANPQDGDYAVWLGSYSGDPGTAVLRITELY
jgi:hypothetical protein